MNNDSKKRRSRKSRFTRKKASTKNSHLSCNACSTSFLNKDHLNHHFKENPSCREAVASAKCSFCTYIGCNENGFKQHLNMSLSCQALYSQMETTTGLLRMPKDTKQESVGLTKEGLISTTYNVPRTSALGTVDTVKVNIQDPSSSKLHISSPNVDNLSTYMKNNRTLASLQNNNFPSYFELPESEGVFFDQTECLPCHPADENENPVTVELELEFNQSECLFYFR